MVDKYLDLVNVGDFYTWSFLLYGSKGSKTQKQDYKNIFTL